MSSKQEHPIQVMGFWMFGFLSVALAVLKLTVAGYWSWWRVMLPFLAFLGHNAAYLLAGFLCFCWLKHEEGEEEPTTVQKHSREGYNLAALLFFFLFLDNLLRRVEGQGWKGFWPCSGRFEVVVLFGMLSLVAQFVLVADCQRPQSRARLKPETMTVTFEEFGPTHDFVDDRSCHAGANAHRGA
jgi:hypothetical protein